MKQDLLVRFCLTAAIWMLGITFFLALVGVNAIIIGGLWRAFH